MTSAPEGQSARSGERIQVDFPTSSPKPYARVTEGGKARTVRSARPERRVERGCGTVAETKGGGCRRPPLPSRGCPLLGVFAPPRLTHAYAGWQRNARVGAGRRPSAPLTVLGNKIWDEHFDSPRHALALQQPIVHVHSPSNSVPHRSLATPNAPPHLTRRPPSPTQIGCRAGMRWARPDLLDHTHP